MPLLGEASVWILISLLIKANQIYGNEEKKTTQQFKVKPPTFAGQYSFVGSAELVVNENSLFLCAVTAITGKWVLTTHSCFSTLTHDERNVTVSMLKDADVKIRLPNFNLDQKDIGEKTTEVNRISVGPKLGNDRLVLMRLVTPISKQLVSKVKAATKDVPPKARCVSVGWEPVWYPGAEALERITELQDITQRVRTRPPNDTDREGAGDRMIWGKTVHQDKHADICKFETGSPLLCQDSSTWILVGVAGNLGYTEYGDECSSSDGYAEYISIKPHVQWMYTEMRKADKHDDTG